MHERSAGLTVPDDVLHANATRVCVVDDRDGVALHLLAIAVQEVALVVQEGEDGDEVKGFRLSIVEGTVAIVRIASRGRQNTEIPARGIGDTAVGVGYKVDLVARGRRASEAGRAPRVPQALGQIGLGDAVLPVKQRTTITRRRG